MSAQARWECCGALVGRKHSPTCDRQTATEFQRPLSLLDASGCLCAGGDCEGCNQIADAFEAMQGALSLTLRFLRNTTTQAFSLGADKPICDEIAAVLALADKVMTRGR